MKKIKIDIIGVFFGLVVSLFVAAILIMAFKIDDMATTPAVYSAEDCPTEIKLGQVVTYITGTRGVVINCRDESIQVYTGESLQSWRINTLVDPEFVP